MQGKIIAVCRSEKTGVPKVPCGEGLFIADFGLEGDAHAATGINRQVSLLSVASIDKMQGHGIELKYGDFAENLTISGLELHSIPVGTRLKVGSEVVLEISQIGKTCHSGCAIFKAVGSCIMPKEGVFARVIEGGTIRTGDAVAIGGGK
ncbi:MAG: MOSC domain-containing protein [Deltaproteobacteria bacterium]|nr:MOSC domain-containing protein [Deltaproteobacteria bacterium]